MPLAMASRLVLATGGLVLMALPGCSANCGATNERLASLRPGMSYEQTAAIMGCPGRQATRDGPASGEASAIVWDGPESMLFNYTQVEFLDGKLLWYATVSKGGY
jgi:hypothetical protein